MNGGMTGCAMLPANIPDMKIDGKVIPPTWKPKDHGPGESAAEIEYKPNYWKREPEKAYQHGYDCSRMYLAAAGACEALAPFSLKSTGPREFNPRVAGWWELELSPWQHSQIPNPIGSGRSDSIRWVTTPTAALLAELTAAGEYGGFTVKSSWTANGKRLLRGWSKKIEDTYQGAVKLTGVQADEYPGAVAVAGELAEDGGPTSRAQDAARVRIAAKDAYREGCGAMGSPTNWVYRPDWHHSIIAQARVNLWRKMWRVGQQENRWPLRIDTDNVWYDSDSPDPVASKPESFAIGDKLGQFKPKGSK
jgi:hypothetical protein